MSIYTLIPIVFIALYLGYWFYIKNKNSQQAQIVSNTDFKAEFTNAEKYKNHFLTSELPFLKKAMEQEKIDVYKRQGYGGAFTYFLFPKLQAKVSYEHTYRLPEAFETVSYTHLDVYKRQQR